MCIRDRSCSTVDALWHTRNDDIHRCLKMPIVTGETKRFTENMNKDFIKMKVINYYKLMLALFGVCRNTILLNWRKDVKCLDKSLHMNKV